MKLKEEDEDVDMDTVSPADWVNREASASASGVGGVGTSSGIKRQSRSPVKQVNFTDSPATKSEQEETIGGEVILKLEPGKPPKLARSTSHKVEKRQRALFTDYEDKTAEARATFDTLEQCTYANKYLGTTEHALECDCAEEWGKSFLSIAVIYMSFVVQPSDIYSRHLDPFQQCLRRGIRLH